MGKNASDNQQCLLSGSLGRNERTFLSFRKISCSAKGALEGKGLELMINIHDYGNKDRFNSTTG